MRNLAFFLALSFTILFVSSLSAQDQDIDLMGVRQLAEAGSDVTKPHPIKFFLYFNDRNKADGAVLRLLDEGFEDLTVQSENGGGWLLLISRTMIPKASRLKELRSMFQEICFIYDGEYDGWETPLVK